jgi:O-antigen/teichoic acid export membrane protein
MYGPSEYAGAIEPLRILAFAAVAVWVSSITSVVVSAGPDPGINTRIAFVMAASNIAMNILILPKFGASGAAATTVATEFLGVVLNSLYIWRRLLPLPYGALFWGGLACVAIGLGGRWVFPSPWLAPLALAAFLALAVVTRSLTIADLRDLVTAFSGSRLRNP